MNIKVDKKIIFLIILIFCSYPFLLRPVKAKRERMKQELGEREDFLIKCLTAREGLPSKEAVERLLDERNALNLRYQTLANKVFYPPISLEQLPQDKERWPLYFRKVLYLTTNELISQAQKEGVSISSSLGFSNELPPQEEVLTLLNRLALIRKFILIAIEQDIKQILAITPLLKKGTPGEETNLSPSAAQEEQSLENIAPQGSEKSDKAEKIAVSIINQPFIEEYPILVKFACDTRHLFNLLYQLQKKGQFYLIRNIQIRQDLRSQDQLIVDLFLSALLEKEDVIPEEVKEIEPVQVKDKA